MARPLRPLTPQRSPPASPWRPTPARTPAGASRASHSPGSRSRGGRGRAVVRRVAPARREGEGHSGAPLKPWGWTIGFWGSREEAPGKGDGPGEETAWVGPNKTTDPEEAIMSESFYDSMTLEETVDLDAYSIEQQMPSEVPELSQLIQQQPVDYFISTSSMQLLREVLQDVRHVIVWPFEDELERSRHRYTGFVRLKYKLQRAIWSSTTGQYVLLLTTVTLLAFTGGAVYSSMTGEELGESLWKASGFVLDAGTVSGESAPAARLVGLALTIVGLLLVSVLVGIVGQTIEQQVASVTSQLTQVLESDHIVVLNWNSSAPRLVRELALGNRDTEGFKRNPTIVVLSEIKQAVMTYACREISDGDSNSDVLCIEGSPQLVSSLNMVSAIRARSIVILGDEENGSSSRDQCDANAVCTMLALTSAAAKAGVTLPTVVMEVYAADTVGLVRRTFGDAVYPVLAGSFASKMTVQSILMPGISTVFKNLLSFHGSEIYFLPAPPEVIGHPFGRLSEIFPGSIPVGIQHPTRLELLPRDSKKIEIGDQLVILQRSRTDYTKLAPGSKLPPEPPNIDNDLLGSFEAEPSSFQDNGGGVHTAMAPGPHTGARVMNALFSSLDDDLHGRRPGDMMLEDDNSQILSGSILICGWRPGIGMVLKTLDKVMSFGSEVHILAEVPLAERDMLLTTDGLDLDYVRNIRLIHFHGSPGIVQDLQQLPVMSSGYTAAVLLANWNTERKNISLSTADAVRMKSTLLLRDFLWQRMQEGAKRDINTYFVTEVSGAGNDLAFPFSEFVEIGALDVMAMSQIVFQPTLHNLQMQLLDTGEGTHLTLEPAAMYEGTGNVMSFQDMSSKVHNQTLGASLLIGYKSDSEVVLNPPKKQLIKWRETYDLVILMRVRSRTKRGTRRAHGERRKRHFQDRMKRKRDQLSNAFGSPYSIPTRAPKVEQFIDKS